MGAFGAISSFAFRRRGRCCVRLAGIGFCKADEPTFWPRIDSGWVFLGVLMSKQTAGMGNLHVRTCSRTTRVTALRMGGFEAKRWRDFLLRHSETYGRGMVRDFHGAHFFFAGARFSLFFAAFAIPLDNTKENDVFLASPRWARPLRRLCSSAHAQMRLLRLCTCCAAPHMRSTAHAHMRTMRICA